MKIEKKILEWIENNLTTIFMVACIVLGIIIRISVRNFASGDFYAFLKPWYIEIAKNGLYKQVGDYNFLYQFAIWLMSKFPFMPSLFSFKILSILFDVLLASTVYLIVKKQIGGGQAIIGFCLVWLSPLVILNSAVWAQCDSIYSTFAILALYMLSKKKYKTSMCLLGVAFGFKLQTIFILPLFLFVYFTSKDFSITNFILIPISMVVISFPALFWNRSIFEVFSTYLNQSNTYQVISKNYPSFWMILCKQEDGTPYKFLKIMTICLTVFILALLMYRWLKKGYKAKGNNLYMMAYIIVYTCVLFLPGMHERYGYMYEILAIVLIFLNPKMIPICIALICVSLNTYGHYLFGLSVNMMALGFINSIIYFVSVYLLDKEMSRSNKEII